MNSIAAISGQTPFMSTDVEAGGSRESHKGVFLHGGIVP